MNQNIALCINICFLSHCLGFNPFYSLRYVLGAEENEPESVHYCTLLFLEWPLRKLHGVRASKSAKPKGLSGRFLQDYCFTSWTFLFLLLSILLLVFPYFALAYLCFHLIFVSLWAFMQSLQPFFLFNLQFFLVLFIW